MLSPIQQASVFQPSHIVCVIISVLQTDVLKGFCKESIASHQNMPVVIDPDRDAVAYLSQRADSLFFQLANEFIQRIHGNEIALCGPVDINDPAVRILVFYDQRLMEVQDRAAEIHQFQMRIHVGCAQAEIRRSHNPGDCQIPELLQFTNDLICIFPAEIHVGNGGRHALNKVGKDIDIGRSKNNILVLFRVVVPGRQTKLFIQVAVGAKKQFRCPCRSGGDRYQSGCLFLDLIWNILRFRFLAVDAIDIDHTADFPECRKGIPRQRRAVGNQDMVRSGLLKYLLQAFLFRVDVHVHDGNSHAQCRQHEQAQRIAGTGKCENPVSWPNSVLMQYRYHRLDFYPQFRKRAAFPLVFPKIIHCGAVFVLLARFIEFLNDSAHLFSPIS